MHTEIKEYLVERFPQIDFSDSKRELVDEVDSLTMVEMIACLSEKYEVEFPYDEITPENFATLDAIIDLVERIKNEK